MVHYKASLDPTLSPISFVIAYHISIILIKSNLFHYFTILSVDTSTVDKVDTVKAPNGTINVLMKERLSQIDQESFLPPNTFDQESLVTIPFSSGT